MKTFFTSDTHFGHKNIVTLGRGRPFVSLEEHDAEITRRWNDVVSPDDLVYHLGDAALGIKEETLPRFKNELNGTIYFVPGNHDNIFSECTKTRQARFMPLYEDVFDKVLDESNVITIDGLTFQISHFPYKENWEQYSDFDRFAKYRPDSSQGLPLVHGHTHQPEKVTHSDTGLTQVSVGVDAWDYTPVPWETVRELLVKG